MNLLIAKISPFINEVETNPITGEIIKDNGSWFWNTVKDGLADFGLWLVNGLFNFLAPFVIWGCKVVIVWCIVVVFCTRDTKHLSTGLKFFLIYLVFFMIRSVL